MLFSAKCYGTFCLQQSVIETFEIENILQLIKICFPVSFKLQMQTRTTRLSGSPSSLFDKHRHAMNIRVNIP